MHIHTDKRAHTHARTHTHTCTHAHAHANTHTHMFVHEREREQSERASEGLELRHLRHVMHDEDFGRVVHVPPGLSVYLYVIHI